MAVFLDNSTDYSLFQSHGVTTLISSVSDKQNILAKSQKDQSSGWIRILVRNFEATFSSCRYYF